SFDPGDHCGARGDERKTFLASERSLTMSDFEMTDEKVTKLAGPRAAYELGASMLLAVVFTGALFVARGFPASAAMFPTFICWLGIGVSLVNAAINAWKLMKKQSEGPAEI